MMEPATIEASTRKTNPPARTIVHGRIRLEGTLRKPVAPRLWMVELRNGHRLLARLPKAAAGNENECLPGDRVVIDVSPYDLSRGRIVRREETPR